MTLAPTFRKFWLLGPVILFLTLFYGFPLWKILALGLTQGWQNPEQLAPLWTSTYHLRILFFTFWQAALSSLLTITLALPGAWILARYKFPGKVFFETLTTIPFVLPTVVVAAAFRTLTDPHSLIGSLVYAMGLESVHPGQGLVLILAAHVFYNLSLALRIIGSFWAHLPPTLTEAARIAGAGSARIFWTITLPLLTPAIGAAGLLVFIFCFSSFGVILLLGGYQYTTLEVEIYRQAAHIFNLPLAAVLSILQLLTTWLVMRFQSGLQRRASRTIMPQTYYSPLGLARKRVWIRLYLALVSLGLIVPLCSLAMESLRIDQGWSLANYISLFSDNNHDYFAHVPPWTALANSMRYALTATSIAVPLGLCAATFIHSPGFLAKIIDPFLMLPMTTSAVTLGFGFILALNQLSAQLLSAWILVPIAHALVAFPFVMRTVLPALAAVPPNIHEAAATLGAKPWTIWWSIDLPLLSRAVLLGAIYAFVISLGEFGATIFIARPQSPTLPLAIYRLLSLPGSHNYGQAMAMSTLLMLLCAISFLLLHQTKDQIWGKF